MGSGPWRRPGAGPGISRTDRSGRVQTAAIRYKAGDLTQLGHSQRASALRRAGRASDAFGIGSVDRPLGRGAHGGPTKPSPFKIRACKSRVFEGALRAEVKDFFIYRV